MNGALHTRLSVSDKQFLATRLGCTQSEVSSFETLLCDENSLLTLLSSSDLTEAVMDDPGLLLLSPPLYFYIVVSHGLRRHGLDDRMLALHISEILDRFQHASELFTKHDENSNSRLFPCVSDALRQIAQAPPRLAHAKRVSLADMMLFMTGVLHDLINEREKRRASPPLKFYEQVGAGQYHIAANDGLAGDSDKAKCYSYLGEEFHRLRLALNDIADRVFHMHGTPIALTS